MSDFARAVFTGIAIGGFAATVFEANILAVKTLLHFNLLAAETACEMTKGVMRGQIERRQEREAEVESES